MEDPYYEVKSEVESTLQHLSILLSSYARIQRTLPPSSHSSSEELSYALAELRATLQALQNDVDELEEALQLVQRDTGMAARLGITKAMLSERRGLVERVKGEMNMARKQLPRNEGQSPDLSSRPRSAYNPTTSTYESLNAENGADNDDDPNAEFETQHQSLLIEQQDQTLTSIAGTVEQLRSQARVMGREVFDQNAMLDELDQQVDSTSSRLERAQRKMDKFIAANKSSPSSWLVFILIIVLSILLFIILFL